MAVTTGFSALQLHESSRTTDQLALKWYASLLVRSVVALVAAIALIVAAIALVAAAIALIVAAIALVGALIVAITLAASHPALVSTVPALIPSHVALIAAIAAATAAVEVTGVLCTHGQIVKRQTSRGRSSSVTAHRCGSVSVLQPRLAGAEVQQLCMCCNRSMEGLHKTLTTSTYSYSGSRETQVDVTSTWRGLRRHFHAALLALALHQRARSAHSSAHRPR